MPPEKTPDPLRGVRVFIAEDDYVLARSLDFLLTSYGCEVAAMAPNVNAALDLIERCSFDIALLDVNLRGDTVAPVAEKIIALGRPLVFLTGYADLDLLPPALRGRRRLDKPVATEELVAALAAELGR